MPGRAGLSELRFLGIGDPDHLDPASPYHLRPGQLLRALTRQLVRYPPTGQVPAGANVFAPAPDAARELPTAANGSIAADGLAYTLRLRPGLRWGGTAGIPVTAQDFVRGLKRVATPAAAPEARAYYAATLAGMAEYCDAYDRAFGTEPAPPAALASFEAAHELVGARAADAETVVLSLERPANDFLNILALGCACAAAPPPLYCCAAAYSLGPYRLTGSPPGELRLTRNAGWPRCAFAPAVRVPVRRLAAAGESEQIARRAVDPAWTFSVVRWNRLGEADDSFPAAYPGFTLNPYLVFNLLSPNERGAMANGLVRRAIAYAVDKAALTHIFGALPGVAVTPLHSVIAPGSVGHRRFNPYPTPGNRGDPAMARRLLADAGYDDGLRLVAAVRDVGLHLEVMRSIARDLSRCGIELTFTTHSPRDYFGALLSDPANARAARWDIAEPGWTPDWFGNNGRAILEPLLKTNRRQGTTNYGGYSNPEVDELLERALEELDRARAEAYWHRIDCIVMDELPILPLLAFACQSCAARTGAAGWSPAAAALAVGSLRVPLG